MLLDYETFFKPLLSLCNFISFFYNTKTCQNKYVIVICRVLCFIRVCLFITCCITLGLSIYILVNRIKIDTTNTLNALLVISGSQGTVSALFLWYWDKEKYFERFAELVQHNHDLKPLCDNKLRRLFKIRNIFMCFFCFIISAFGIYMILIQFSNTLLEQNYQVYFLGKRVVVDLWIHKMLCWGGYLQMVYFFVCLNIFVIFSFVVIHEFDFIRFLIESKPIFDYHYLKTVYMCHLNVCQILDLLNIIFKRFIFICYATNIPLLIIVLFSIMQNRESFDIATFGIKLDFLLMMTLQLIFLSLIPATINHKV